MDPMWTWVIVLACSSLVIFVIELFIPSGGILGSLSLLTLLGALFCLFALDTTYGLVGVGVSVVAAPLAAALALKVFPHTPIGRRLILSDRRSIDEPVRYTSSGEDDYAGLMGAQGIVVTELHPVGVVKFGDRRVECLAERGVVGAGTKVTVVHVAGMEVKVRPV